MTVDDGADPTAADRSEAHRSEAHRSEAAFDAGRTAVDRIVAERFGPGAAVRAHRFVHQPERPIVAVLDLTGASVPTAIVKFAPREPDGVIDDHSEAGWQLANEWATLAFLTMVANERDEGAPELPVPECYGGDREAGLVVMADLGDGDSMAEVLLRDPAVAGPEATDAAVRSFEGYIDAIAALHLATFGTGDQYRRSGRTSARRRTTRWLPAPSSTGGANWAYTSTSCSMRRSRPRWLRSRRCWRRPGRGRS